MIVLAAIVAYVLVGALVLFVERVRVSCEAWTRFPDDKYNRDRHIRDDSALLIIPLWPLALVILLIEPLLKLGKFVLFDSAENFGRACSLRKAKAGKC